RSYLNVQELVESRRSVEHTHQVLETFNKILSGMENAQRGWRGYVFLKDDRELNILRTGIQETNRAIAQTRQLTQDNLGQQRRLDQLQPLIAKRLTVLQQFVDLVRQNKADLSTQRTLLKQTLILQQDIQTRLQEMEGVERTLLQQRAAAVDANVERSAQVNGIGYILSFSILTGVFLLLQKQIYTRKNAETALQQVNEQLETRVQERTMELAEANVSLAAELKERKLAEQSLRDSERQLRLITDALPVLISYLDSKQYYRFNNRTYQEWFKVSQKDLTGQSLKHVVGELAYQTICPYAEAALAGQKVDYEVEVPYRDDGARWVHATYIPDFGEQGEVKGYFALVSDISEAKRNQAERQQSEEQIRRSEERLHLVLQNMPVMLDAFDEEGNIIEWNRECERVTGYRADEVVGNPQSIERLYPDPAYRQQMMQAWSDRGNNYRQWEWDITCKDGSIKTISWSNISDKFPIPGWASWGIGVDVTDRQQAEKQLRQSEQRLSLAIEGSGMATWDVDIQADKALWSEQHFKLLGYDPAPNGEVMLEKWRSRVHPEDMPKIREASTRSQRERSPYSMEHRIIRADNGEIVWVAAFGRAVFNEAGQAVRFVGILIDISDRKVAEEEITQLNQALNRQVKQLETLLEVIPIGIGIAQDPNCNHIKVNPAFAKQLGIPSTINASLSAPNKEAPTFKIYRDGKELSAEELPMQYAAAHGVEVMDVEVDVVHEDGRVITLLEYAAPLLDEQSQIIGCVGAFLDITERKLAKAALQQINEKLEIKVQERTAELNQTNADLIRSNQELEQFAYVASHDLQEPLRAVTGYTQLLAKDYEDQLDETGQQYAAYVIEGATRMQQLIQDLLLYSRIGTRDLVLAPVDCNAVLKRVLDNLQVAIAESNATITSDSLPLITADKTQLTQLFQNLIGNAIKFRREEPPHIHISSTWSSDAGRSHHSELQTPNSETQTTISAAESAYLFTIRDNGIGIKPRYLERIFEIFKRLHTRREFPGTGIGLAVCKKIIDRHNGRIWAESEPEIGTTFYFTLPPSPYGRPNLELNRDSTD
ncbi:PAS domain S-box protein, partial [Phormidium sp. CLA17]|uniref:PAS domain S-box protein n=1 Tax=Leptolyngbya sp. Cla-17 TaxID=2803751 RepID=UPI001490FFD9